MITSRRKCKCLCRRIESDKDSNLHVHVHACAPTWALLVTFQQLFFFSSATVIVHDEHDISSKSSSLMQYISYMQQLDRELEVWKSWIGTQSIYIIWMIQSLVYTGGIGRMHRSIMHSVQAWVDPRTIFELQFPVLKLALNLDWSCIAMTGDLRLCTELVLGSNLPLKVVVIHFYCCSCSCFLKLSLTLKSNLSLDLELVLSLSLKRTPILLLDCICM